MKSINYFHFLAFEVSFLHVLRPNLRSSPGVPRNLHAIRRKSETQWIPTRTVFGRRSTITNHGDFLANLLPCGSWRLG